MSRDCGAFSRDDLPEVLDRATQAVLERYLRFPTKRAFRPRDVRLTHLRIVDGQWALDDLAFAPRQAQHQLGQLADGEFVWVPEVRRLAVAMLEEAHDPVDQIIHVAEGARLRAVAIDGERLAAQRLDDEVRHDTAIVRPHARAIRVEDPDDPRVELVEAMIRHGERFGETFCFVIHPAWAHGVHVPPIRFGLRVHQRVAVHFRRRGEQEAGMLRHGETQRLVGAEGADLQRLDRQLEIVDRAGGAREVQHAIERSFDFDVAGDVLVGEPEARMRGDVRQVRRIARDVIVHSQYVVPERQELVYEMRSEESGRARYEDAHPSWRPILS